ncbi:MAG TPA: primosomal protein N' [Clostridiaceae bacterium]|nr:primosomal protein N' [Clostridiaceae bacterium]
MGNIASVVISNCTREFDKEYHYLIPDKLLGSVKPGVRVIVPFGAANRPREAYVLSLPDSTDFTGLKEIQKVLDKDPVLNEDVIELVLWMKDRYICTYYDAIKCALPSGIGIKSQRVIKIKDNGYISDPHSCKLKENVRKILDALVECGNECEFEELKEKTDVRNFPRYIKQLEEAGYVEIEDVYTSRVKEKTVRVAYLALPDEEIIEEIESGRIKRIQQIRVLEMLMENEYISVADIMRFANVSASVLDTLRKYGYINYKDVEVKRDPYKSRTIERSEPLKPTPQQADALEKIKGKIEMLEFGEVLVHGITGSGKTELYLQLIQYVIEKGRQAIVLVPEISLTPQTVERFKSRFGDNIAVLHSRLSLGERYDQWRLIKEGRVNVAVGARSAIFAPFSNLGIIIIDEEHESSYKSETTPKYRAAEIAQRRCKYHKAVLLYGSATPSVETYYRAVKGEIDLVELTERANQMDLPSVHVVDMRKELDEGNRSIFSRKLQQEIDASIKQGQQAILFLNRRGYASFVLCRSCGYVVKCINCNISLTYHAFDERLICHYCGYTIKTPKQCPKCGSKYIRHFGTGTQKVEEEIKKEFPECSVIRMDMDTTTCKNSHEEILQKFREQNVNIMVGTQMIAKGHDFPNVTLVGVLAADSLLNVGDFRASERTFQLITQVAGRAGRGEIPGRVVIQTYNTEDFSIVSACKHDYAGFYKQEILLREKLGYPPFKNIALLIISGTSDRVAFSSAKETRKLVESEFAALNGAGVEILGPSRSPVTRINKRYRWRLVIKCRDEDILINVLGKVSDMFYKKRGKNNVELSVDINPLNML